MICAGKMSLVLPGVQQDLLPFVSPSIWGSNAARVTVSPDEGTSMDDVRRLAPK